MTPDSAPESILFADTDFDWERFKWLLNEYRRAKSRPVISSGDVDEESLSDRKGNENGFESFRQETAKTLLFRVEIEFGAQDRFIGFYRRRSYCLLKCFIWDSIARVRES